MSKFDVVDAYESLMWIRDEDCDGKRPWVWFKGESGSWWGPHNEFPELRNMIMKYVKGRSVIFQAGGCMGLFPALWARHFSYVYTFEPDPLNFYYLVRNTQFDNIFKLNAGLGNSHEPLQVQRSTLENVGMHKTAPNGPVPQLRIDDFEVSRLDAIQLDCEGAEHNIILGGMENIKKFLPVISMETAEEQTVALLTPLGYKRMGSVVSDTVFAIE